MAVEAAEVVAGFFRGVLREALLEFVFRVVLHRVGAITLGVVTFGTVRARDHDEDLLALVGLVVVGLVVGGWYASLPPVRELLEA